jgi:hypothetical protein
MPSCAFGGPRDVDWRFAPVSLRRSVVGEVVAETGIMLRDDKGRIFFVSFTR